MITVRTWHDLTPAEQSAHYEWKYGPRGGRGHLVEPDPESQTHCVARSPQGLLCARRVNWIGHEHFRPRGEGPGNWRHGPRPYGRAGAA